MPLYADPDLVAQLSQDYSYHVDEDEALAAAHTFAEDVELLTVNATEAGASGLAARMKPLGLPGMGGWSLKIPGVNFVAEVGQTVAVRAPHWPSARAFLVAGTADDCDAGECTLKLIGGRQ